MAQERLDANANVVADLVCDGFFMDDPNVTLEMAQRAAVAGQRLSQQVDKYFKTHFALDRFSQERLEKLGIDPHTLQPLETRS